MNISVVKLIKDFSKQNNVIRKANLHYYTLSRSSLNIPKDTFTNLNLFLKTTFDYAIARTHKRATIILNDKLNENELVLKVKDYGTIPSDEVFSFFNIDYHITKSYSRFGAYDSIFISNVKELLNRSISITFEENYHSYIEFSGHFPYKHDN